VDTQEAQRRWEQFTEALTAQEAWDPSKHPRQGGPPNAGWWASTGGSGGSSGGVDHADTSNAPNGTDDRGPTPHMLELAHAWWQTKGALQRARRDIEELPRRIASERAQLGSGGRYAYIHTQNLAKAQRGLETAKALVPQLQKQQSDLEQQYHDSGYAEVPYSTWTPGETLVGGRGIEDVGRAVSMGGSPAGLKPTGIEFDIALGAPAILQLGKAVLRGTLSSASGKFGSTIDDFVAKLPRKTTPTTSAASQYEVKHSGPYNYTVSGGGAKFDIDGYRGSTILEAKHVGNPKSSPYVPGSSCPQTVRTEIVEGARSGLRKIRTIIESGSTPFKSVEIITNSPEAQEFFQGLLKETRVPGIVRLEP
jgi:hypothetical protein